ncbi:MAG: peptidoglycan-associated lipoprotein Pal [Alphaproteobacteria bacterium]|nr:peptidoglycan-associated lipoprotein Pal [Alphaproteobacteria bacterium]
MRINLPVVVAAAFLLAACSSASDEGADAGSDGTSTTPPPISDTNVAPVQPVGAAPGSQLDLEINVGDRVLFGFDQSTLTSTGRTQVERWADWLEVNQQNKLLIEGHADERGTREYNLALGERRANAAREYLVSLGVAPNRLRTISFGKERPAIPGSSENAYAQNRRAVAVLDAVTN